MTRQDKQDIEKLIIEKINICSLGIRDVSSPSSDEQEAVAIYNLVNALDILNRVVSIDSEVNE